LDLDFEYTLNILQYEFKNPYFNYKIFKILPAKHLWHPIFGLTYMAKTTRSDPPEDDGKEKAGDTRKEQFLTARGQTKKRKRTARGKIWKENP
jgi:hypothetical protein